MPGRVDFFLYRKGFLLRKIFQFIGEAGGSPILKTFVAECGSYNLYANV